MGAPQVHASTPPLCGATIFGRFSGEVRVLPLRPVCPSVMNVAPSASALRLGYAHAAENPYGTLRTSRLAMP